MALPFYKDIFFLAILFKYHFLPVTVCFLSFPFLLSLTLYVRCLEDTTVGNIHKCELKTYTSYEHVLHTQTQRHTKTHTDTHAHTHRHTQTHTHTHTQTNTEKHTNTQTDHSVVHYTFFSYISNPVA